MINVIGRWPIDLEVDKPWLFEAKVKKVALPVT